MPTPVGPASADPDDPDLWDEWYEADPDTGPSFGWPVRLLAVLFLVGIVLLVVSTF